MNRTKTYAAWASASALLAFLAFVLWHRGMAQGPRAPGPGQNALPALAMALPMPGSKVALRPLAVASGSSSHEWTAEDATTPEVIAKIAHNRAEFVRLVQENARIERRQLVYRKEPAWVLVERAKGAGVPLSTLTLPGLDGREVVMEIENADLSDSGLSGSFYGHVAGRGDSLATLAFERGRESFTVVSPSDGLYLQGSPREPGEVVVASFDPQKYLPLPCGNTETASR